MPFTPTPLLRNAHIQSALASSKLRKLRVHRAYGRNFAESAQEVILDCGDGVRLQAWISEPADPVQGDRPVLVMLHGWEGSAESAYVYAPGAYLFARGFTIVRLNFRDHGQTHHLNPDLFHGNRLDEVVGAMRALRGRYPHQPMVLAGFSMGGNFALRVALAAPAVGLSLDRVVAVNPALTPARVSERIDTGPAMYRRHFLRKWRRSLRRKQACFPERYDFADELRMTSILQMTEVLARRHCDAQSLDEYFAGYTITRDAMLGLTVPTTIFMAEDDPVVPVDDFHALPEVPALTVEIQRHGGHCGYITDFRLRAWIERQLLDALRDLDARAPAPN